MNRQVYPIELMKTYGFKESLIKYYEPLQGRGLALGRVITQHSNIYTLMTEKGPIKAETTGKYRYAHEIDNSFPVIGDFVAFEAVDQETRGIIHELLPRMTKFSRKVAGNETVEQCVAANFDTVFIFNALNKDFNVRKIERFLSIAWDSGATPVVILSKVDLCDDVEEKLAQVTIAAPGVDIIPISSVNHTNIERLGMYLQPGHTIALLGASGVGKSTLINTLAQEEILKTQEVRVSDDRGKHTTTHKELVMLPNGTMLLDTPGMRELGMWTNTEGIGESFSDIEALAKQCKFADCQHMKEPGCRIRSALLDGTLEEKRYKNYQHLLREAAFAEAKYNDRLRMEQKKKWKEISKFQKLIK